MKKIPAIELFGWVVVLAIVSLACLSGCEIKIEPEDITTSDYWDVSAYGEIISITEYIKPGCKNGTGCNTTTHWHEVFKFDDGTEVRVRKIKNRGMVKVGQTGKLYRRRVDSNYDFRCRFEWVPDIIEKEDATVEKKEVEPEEIVKIVYQDNYEWIHCSDENPERFQMVLIKFKDGTMSLGYRNHINEWKLSINKNQEDGGKTISRLDIISWRQVNVD